MKPNGTYGRLDRKGGVRAPALPQDTALWVQGKPVSLIDQQGHPVLLDFWTGGCINCLHASREIEELARMFPSLTVVGVHTPKFSHEATNEAVAAAIARFGITHPVVNDHDEKLRELYTVRAWPTLILIAPNGKIALQLSGEGRKQELAAALQEMDQGHQVSQVRPAAPKSSAGLFDCPGKLTLDPQTGMLYVADTGHHRILAFGHDGELVAQVGSGEKGFVDGHGDSAQLFQPQGVTYDVQKRCLYFADSGNHALRCWNLEHDTVTTLLGDGIQGKGYPPVWKGAEARLNAPWDLTSHQEKLYIACAGSHQLWSYDPKREEAEVILGTGEENLVDGVPAQALLAQPFAITSDGTNLYWLDTEASALRRWNGKQVETLVGTGLFAFGFEDGSYPNAQLQHPQGLTYHNGKLWIADTYNQAVRVFDLQSGLLSTILTDVPAPQDLIWREDQLLILHSTLIEWTGEVIRPLTFFRCEGEECIILNS